ncbi:MAG: PAS domain S-box protein [Candidatus Thorarchaeota archaeon]|nr:PAS domain S-box protein [Candidatus Thorarchaeota archaeon]
MDEDSEKSTITSPEERHQVAGKRLEGSPERYRALFRSIRDAILVADTERRIVDCNPAFTELFGYQIEEIAGKKTKYVYATDEDYRSLGEKIKKHTGDSSFFFEIEYKTKRGETFTGETNVFYLRDSEGNIEGFIGLIRDVSERIALEERQEFLYSLLRHDLSNVLMVVHQYLELLETLNLPEKGHEYTRKARSALEDGTDLIGKVSTLEKAQEARDKNKSIALTSLTDSIQDRIDSRKGKTNMQIEVKLPEEEVSVKGGELWVQVFENLIMNAIQHSEGNLIRVSGKNENEEIRISVEDDGIGIPDDVKPKIFEKGYKKGTKAGFGLGLYLTKRITETYDGRIEVKDSELGGVKFDVYLQPTYSPG